MYKLELSEQVDKKFSKLAKKNKSQLSIIDKKLKEILQHPERYKKLRGDMKGAQRVHIDKHFVLVFEAQDDIVRVLDYDHHDNIY